MAIFLSYSRQDEETVKTLARGLEAARRQVWYDHVLGAGDAWWAEILANIRDTSVFVFGLSDASLGSKPCLAELEYARALGRPILPVQVGPVRGMRANPVSDLHVVVYRSDNAASGFEVFAAVDAVARRTVPLPDPLPPEPSIPYAYLKALSTQINSTSGLDAETQVRVLDQLRTAIGEESEESVRGEILGMLRDLMEKPWITRRTERDAEAIVIAWSPEQVTAVPPNTPPPTVTPDRPQSAESPSGVGSPQEPDGKAIFEQRMAELTRVQEHDRRRAGTERPPVAPGKDEWAGQPAGSWANPGAPAPTAPEPEPMPPGAPMPNVPAQVPIPYQPTRFPSPPPQQMGPHSEPQPPTWWGLSIVAFLMVFVVGGVAMYFSYQVGQLYQARDYAGARRASQNAKGWGIAGVVVGALVFFIALGSGG